VVGESVLLKGELSVSCLVIPRLVVVGCSHSMGLEVSSKDGEGWVGLRWWLRGSCLVGRWPRRWSGDLPHLFLPEGTSGRSSFEGRRWLPAANPNPVASGGVQESKMFTVSGGFLWSTTLRASSGIRTGSSECRGH
jgi:hypothetical protein